MWSLESHPPTPTLNIFPFKTGTDPSKFQFKFRRENTFIFWFAGFWKLGDFGPVRTEG